MAEITLHNVDQVDISRVLQAAMTNNVGELQDLIQRDPNILHKFSLSSFTETPLHISSLRGHLEFTEVLVKEKPDMAIEPNPKGYCPLHYASAEGHVEVVKALLKSRKEACVFGAHDGKIPLHFAVMRDRVEVVKLLVAANPHSIAVTLHGETVFHLCVRYNSVESLKELVRRDHTDEATKANHDGNTILHLAAMLRQLESLKYIISVPKLKAEINAVNKIGFSALDLLEYYCPKDFETLEVRYLLVDAGGTRTQKTSLPEEPTRKVKQLWKNFVNGIAFDWIEGARGSLMIVATVIAQMTYQSAMNPPGGVWQESYHNVTYINGTTLYVAGTSVMASLYQGVYALFLAFNAVGFASSLGIILLIVAGFPIGNKYFLLAFTIAMCVSITSLASSYLFAIDFLSPQIDVLHILYGEGKIKVQDAMIIGWLALLAVAGLVYSIRIVHWIVPKVIKWKALLLSYYSSTREVQIP